MKKESDLCILLGFNYLWNNILQLQRLFEGYLCCIVLHLRHLSSGKVIQKCDLLVGASSQRPVESWSHVVLNLLMSACQNLCVRKQQRQKAGPHRQIGQIVCIPLTPKRTHLFYMLRGLPSYHHRNQLTALRSRAVRWWGWPTFVEANGPEGIMANYG